MPPELHPFVIHLAVGLLVAAPACDAAGLILRREGLLQAGRWNTLIGTIAGGLAVLSGIAARAELGPHSAAGEALLNLHNAFGYVMLVLWVPAALWRAFSRQALPGRRFSGQPSSTGTAWVFPRPPGSSRCRGLRR